ASAFLLMALESRASRSPELPVYAQVNDFVLTNQNNAVVSLNDLRGKVWVADIIFTRCPGPCKRMTQQMKELQTALEPGNNARLVSLTTDPEFDTPAILSRYAERFGADTNRWTFLTGSKKQIADVAVGSLKLAVVEKKPEERESADDLFIHSTIFVVVDRRGQLRGVFETGGDDVDWPKSKQGILATVKSLEAER
ncbi:MAG TPA: SCO family protein, partial [Candidatus Paceibacterota bacterium]|nr:SCO family protein [Candidatus Paceibacterota bacterium]